MYLFLSLKRLKALKALKNYHLDGNTNTMRQIEIGTEIETV